MKGPQIKAGTLHLLVLALLVTAVSADDLVFSEKHYAVFRSCLENTIGPLGRTAPNPTVTMKLQQTNSEEFFLIPTYTLKEIFPTNCASTFVQCGKTYCLAALSVKKIIIEDDLTALMIFAYYASMEGSQILPGIELMTTMYKPPTNPEEQFVDGKRVKEVAPFTKKQIDILEKNGIIEHDVTWVNKAFANGLISIEPHHLEDGIQNAFLAPPIIVKEEVLVGLIKLFENWTREGKDNITASPIASNKLLDD